MKVNADVAIRAGLMQALLVMILALVLALLFSKQFFEDWGWITGPLAWLGCAALVTRRLGLPYFPALIGAAVAGVPSLLALALGLHWLGPVLGVVVFAIWCGSLEPRGTQLSSRPRT